MLKNAPALAIRNVHTAENAPCEVCQLSVDRSPKTDLVQGSLLLQRFCSSCAAINFFDRFEMSPFDTTSWCWTISEPPLRLALVRSVVQIFPVSSAASCAATISKGMKKSEVKMMHCGSSWHQWPTSKGGWTIFGVIFETFGLGQTHIPTALDALRYTSLK